MSIPFVAQKDRLGCGLACLAMVTGMTYDAVRETMPEWTGERHGLHSSYMVLWLNGRGYWTRWRFGAPTESRHPVIAYADGHWIVIDGSTVHDPAGAAGAPLRQYVPTQWIEVRTVEGGTPT